MPGITTDLVWILPLCVLGFLVVWAGVCLFSSWLSGWQRLARTYRATQPLPGSSWGLQSATLRWWASYNQCLRFTVHPQGMEIAVFPAFRLGHPPLCIPWTEITIRRQTQIWGARVVCTFQREPSIPVQISPRLADKMQQALGPVWPEPAAVSHRRELKDKC